METLSFMDSVQLIQWVKGISAQMLLFIVTDLRPSGKSIRESPAVNRDADTVENGHTGVLRVPKSGGKCVGGVKRRGWRSHSGRGKNRLDNVWGWGRILSRGERRMGGRIVQV